MPPVGRIAICSSAFTSLLYSSIAAPSVSVFKHCPPSSLERKACIGVVSYCLAQAPRPRTPRSVRAKAAIERLSQAPKGPWSVGDRCQVRDKADDRWLEGKVASICPVKVQLDGGKRACSWRQIEAASKSWWTVGDQVLVRDAVEDTWASGTVSSTDPVKVQVDGGEPRAWRMIQAAVGRSNRPVSSASRARSVDASSTRLARACQLSKRQELREVSTRRQKTRQKDERTRHREESAARHRSLSPGRLKELADSAKNLMKSTKDEQRSFFRQKLEDVKEDGKPLTASRFKKILIGAAVKIATSRGAAQGVQPGEPEQSEALSLLTVKERQAILKDLRHPLPHTAATEDQLLTWLSQQLFSQRCLRLAKQPQAPSDELKRLVSTDRVAELVRLRGRLEEAKEEEDHQLDIVGLEKILLREPKLKLEAMALLTVKERKKILAELGHPFPAAASAEKDFLEWLQKQISLRRAERMRPSQRQLEALEGLKRTEKTEKMALLRAKLDTARVDQESPLTAAVVGNILTEVGLELDALQSLPFKELKLIFTAMGMFVAGSAADIVEQLRHKLWSDRISRRPCFAYHPEVCC
ncbi:unnamed protein product [Polarella glacialis]|uniref:RNA helicase n=1 Tax=Polarella glacialis TaxID=89957 RepID=A0A813KZQ3_POLGL|nr:unnamed protein product [Polarella glacialis]